MLIVARSRRFEWKHLEVTVTEEKAISVFDILSGATETLGAEPSWLHWSAPKAYGRCLAEFREKIVKVSVDFGHLIVGTSTQVYIHNERAFNTPCIIDLPQHGMITALLQAKECFLLVDNSKGIQVYSYDGKLVSSPKYPGMKPEALSNNNVALSNDTLIVRDSINEKRASPRTDLLALPCWN